MGKALTEAGEIYEKLWDGTSALLKSRQLRIDNLLRNRDRDARRGVTLVARPDVSVQRKVEAFLQKAADYCPRQHFYKPVELHVTVMAIISGSDAWRNDIRRLPACRAALEEVLKGRGTFQVDFRGVTISPDAVMIQGFPADDGLSQLRDDLRRMFAMHGLSTNLDRRYKTTTAHLTAVRFSDPEAEWERLLDFLRMHRKTDFGLTRFQSLQLIWSDWYASADTVRVLREYPLELCKTMI